MRRAAEWIALALDPSRPTTLVGLPLVSDEQLEAMRFDAAADAFDVPISALHAANHTEIGAPDRRPHGLEWDL